ncbi:MAG: hypothetical protein HKN91_03940 [Acidimicrobiia bacterium]|nr:hypothetical protein [Acidimicrobiia bacterium]
MAHFRLGQPLVFGLALVMLVSSCSDADSSSTTSSVVDLEIRADGIGAVDLGQPPGPALAELNSFFGEPDIDSGWIPAASPLYGTCPGLAMRATGWGSLYAFFVSDSPEISGDNEDISARLFSFSYGYDFNRNEGATDPRGLNLTTADGIGLGSTRAELRILHDNALTEAYSATADTWTWELSTGSGELRGLFDGPDDDAEVVLMETTPGCEIG